MGLRFRNKNAGALGEQLDLVEIVVEDLAAAGLAPNGTLTLSLTPRADNPNGAKPPAFGCVLDVPVAVPGDARAWCDALRAVAAAKKGAPK